MSRSLRQERRARHHDLGRNQLLDAAEEVFGTKGYHAATLREVAELAEFSVGSVYSFFEGKDDLYLHVFLRRGDAFLDGIRAVVEVDRLPLEAVRALVAFEVGFFRDHPHFARLYLRSASLAQPVPGGSGAGIGTFTEVIALQRGLLEAGQADGTIRSMDPTALLAVLSGIVTAVMSVDPLVAGGASVTAEPLAIDAVTDLAVAALRA